MLCIINACIYLAEASVATMRLPLDYFGKSIRSRCPSDKLDRVLEWETAPGLKKGRNKKAKDEYILLQVSILVSAVLCRWGVVIVRALPSFL